MSYTDLRDFAPEYSVTITDYMDVDVYVIQLEALGGGTYGKAYQGQWRYVVTKNGEELGRGQDFHTGFPKTHRQVAEILADTLSEGDVTDYEFSYAREEKYLDEHGWVVIQ